ncbi:glutamate synthase (NADPH) large subunit [Melghiribacillus thermohalophilus]|uniref:Glutamate synthase (NADPH) large subunit n=1 Tax=Melghiribacillus thermohalophilus TaxID=1324956 RepID=A0A4R3N8G7_9BACI|nr:glutamate synthase large subunit [Melghiribacillus thermohalophilus]TCT25468.1 glutamate synthase (NADPH) large subunit [Melghiribacillus thermohalophilus]
MTDNHTLKPRNLYRPEFEHDACGIGLYAHLKGKASHEVVQKALSMLCKMEHRGGQGSDDQTGDGSGIMLQIPHSYFQYTLKDIELPSPGNYGVGMIFLPQDKVKRQSIENEIVRTIEKEGQKLLGWRTVPVQPEAAGKLAQKTRPCIRQVFIGRSKKILSEIDFERKLYVIRKQLENQFKHERAVYFASLSSRTIVYKGLLTPEQLKPFFLDLQDERFRSAFALVHNRFSTNTFPSWERAHPNRYLVHNGEINTLRGNVNWMRAREKQFESVAFGEDLEKVKPILDLNGSDSSILDNAFEFFVLAGRKPAHVAMMLIPEPWNETEMDEKKQSFYEYHSCLMEPWDGPTAISFTDGRQIGAILDRNGLRPARYYVTKDDYLIFSSEVGVIDIEPENVLLKDRLSPGKMLLLDMEEGRIVSDEEIKQEMSGEKPYGKWVSEQLIPQSELPKSCTTARTEDLITLQKAFGYTYEDLTKTIVAMIEEGKDPIGSMGNDVPLAVLSDRPQSLFNYFKQIFAQVTNPPIDAIREKLVTSTMTLLGREGNILDPNPTNARRIRLESPFISNERLAAIEHNPYADFTCTRIPIVFSENMEKALNDLFQQADEAIQNGASILILSDRGVDEDHIAIPSLLAGSALHQHLVRQGTRTMASIIMETGEVREVHHFAALIGYGVDAVNPYLTLETIEQLAEDGTLSVNGEEAVEKYLRVTTDGVVKVMSKMGISTIQSYRGAQIFEALGIGEEVIEKYFTGTPSQLGGITLDVIEKEAKLRHEKAFKDQNSLKILDTGSELQWRKNGEHHALNPKTIHTLQLSCRKNDYRLYKEFSKLANEERVTFLRNLFDFKMRNPVPIEEVESAESIVRRFKTGAMSFGALSQEAHEALAIAMNRLGGKSNSGEGGEDPKRYTPDKNGDLRRSAIKQIASGRFGVNSHYLVNADELQIKMAQGAKPGEGGQLPGKKVYPWVAKVRGSTPGVELISPPPHHDIYSIEDLAQLIHDLKNANQNARISVKLVSRSGVGTIAAGVAKGNADVIVISGYDGGTGASPKTSIKHAGLPWELGLAETHQTLMLNGLRDRVILETDGKLMTGKDVVMAALLGAEEFAFATAPLVVLGCVMMRACHLDTCPVGIATQDPELRKKFMGHPDHIVNYMMFIAQEVREIMAELGFRTLDEMVGRTDLLEVSERATNHWKAKYLDLSRLLYQPEGIRTFQNPQNHKIEESLDVKHILPAIRPALEKKIPVTGYFKIHNTHRVVGTVSGSEVTKRYGEEGLPEDTIHLHFAGSAGQSFGAYVPKGMTLQLTGDANDYVGKGLSGGKIIVKAPEKATFKPENHVIIGNVAFYGATSGEAYIQGIAGERFCVRNSGVKAVVEGVGDHGCEYMTGGRVVILGSVGKNFAAGMSGGIAYVFTNDREQFKNLCNPDMIRLEKLEEQGEIQEVKQMVQQHFRYTGSEKAASILANWNHHVQHAVKVIPKNYKQMIETIGQMKQMGLSDDEAALAAYEASFKQPEENTEDPARVEEPVAN